HAGLAPHLMGWIAERLAELNTPDEDIFVAYITFVQQKSQEVARVQLQVAGKLLQVTQRGATPDVAIDAALQKMQRALQKSAPHGKSELPCTSCRQRPWGRMPLAPPGRTCTRQRWGRDSLAIPRREGRDVWQRSVHCTWWARARSASR